MPTRYVRFEYGIVAPSTVFSRFRHSPRLEVTAPSGGPYLSAPHRRVHVQIGVGRTPFVRRHGFTVHRRSRARLESPVRPKQVLSGPRIRLHERLEGLPNGPALELEFDRLSASCASERAVDCDLHTRLVAVLENGCSAAVRG